MDWIEIQIPVPWGIIAAKSWGSSNDPLALVVHGWIDNANSFDTLIPLLPRCFNYVCIDLPGHGRSSPIQTLALRDIDYIIAYKLIYDHFKRDKITIIAHSLGAFTTMVFTQFYPQCVSKIVVLDIFYFFPRPPSEYFQKLKLYYNIRIKFLPKETKNGPVYTKEEIMEKLINGRLTPISRKAAEILIERSVDPAGDGKYRMTLAQNVKHLFFTEIHYAHIASVIRELPIKCPHLLIMSTNTSSMRFAYKDVHKEYKKNPNFEFHIVDGTHEVHLENPKLVAPIIRKFLLKHQNKL